MDYQIKLPHVGESVVEAVIGEWLVEPGQAVEKFDPLVEIVTDKVAMELPSPAAGKITKILAVAGDTVAMGAPIAEMDAEEVPQEELSARPSEDLDSDPIEPDRIGTLVQGVNVVSMGSVVKDTSAPQPESPEPVDPACGKSANPDWPFSVGGSAGGRAQNRSCLGTWNRSWRTDHEERHPQGGSKQSHGIGRFRRSRT